jgi:hypothetical protein
VRLIKWLNGEKRWKDYDKVNDMQASYLFGELLAEVQRITLE